MPDLSSPDGGMSPRLAAAVKRFDAAYAEFLAAKADYVADHDDDVDEAADRARYDRQSAAERALVSTPAPHSSAFWEKFALLERALTEEADTGQLSYPLTIVMLGALKADILALGLRPWPDA